MKNIFKEWLPPDPEELNHQRACWAAGAIAAFRGATQSDLEDALCDLIADLGHWCDRNSMNLAAEIERGKSHYGEETDREGKQFESQRAMSDEPLQAEVAKLRGLVARNALQRLTAMGNSSAYYFTAQDIKDSLDVLYAEQDAGRMKKL